MYKRLIVLTSLVVLVIASCKKNPTDPPNPPAATSDTVALWKFDGNLNDASGNGHNGTDAGYFPGRPITYGPDRFGHANSAIVLQGQSAVVVADKSDLDFTSGDSFTISAWVQTTDTTFWDVVAKGPEDMSKPGYQLGASSFMGGHAGWVWSNITSSTAGANWNMKSPNMNVSDGRWHMVTLVVTAHTGAVLYADSILAGTLTDPGLQPDLHNSASLLIGNDPTKATRFEGSIDEVLILHHALTISEIATRFHEAGWYEHPDSSIYRHPIDTISFQWQLTAAPQNFGIIDDMCWALNSANDGYACGYAGSVYATHDGGATWLDLNERVIYNNVNTALTGISFIDKNIGVSVGGQDVHSVAAIVTSDAGKTWKLGVLPSGVAALNDVKILPDMGYDTYAVGADSAGNGVILHSGDYGLHWNVIKTTPKPLRAIGFSGSVGPDAQHPVLIVGDGGQIYTTTTSGSVLLNGGTISWTDRSFGTKNLLAVSVNVSNNLLECVIGTDQATALFMLDTLDHPIGGWVESSFGTDGAGLYNHALYAAGGKQAWVAGDRYILYTADGGLSWVRAVPYGYPRDWHCIAAQDPKHIAFLGGDAHLYWVIQ